MAKINRYDGNLKAFAADALGSERTIFGDTAQSNTLDANITADLFRGWGIVGVNENPTKQDFNGLGYTLGQLLAYLHQVGIPEWNTEQEVYEGSVVTTLAGVYRLKSGGDGTVDPDSDGGTNWELAPTRAQVDAKAPQATTYTKTEADSLFNAKANISGQLFTGEVFYRGAGNITTNTSYGEGVLSNNTTGSLNAAIGRDALLSNTTGSLNTATGRSSLINNTTGSDNTANGGFSLLANTIGGNNTANGRSALSVNTSGNNNTASGRGPLSSNTTGSDNTAIGSNSLLNNTIGDFNTAVGVTTGLGIVTGSGNSIFGADVRNLSSSLENNLILASGGVIRLRHDATDLTVTGGVKPSNDNAVALGTASLRWSEVFAGTGTINTSDAREKTPVRGMIESEILAAKEIAKEIGVYQFLASVEEKGDKARQHIGLTVQRATEIMESNGLDAMAYGFICYDEWDDIFVEHDKILSVEAVEESEEVEYVEAVEGVSAWTEQIQVAGNRYGFRYDQLNLFVARGFEARISALEEIA